MGRKPNLPFHELLLNGMQNGNFMELIPWIVTHGRPSLYVDLPYTAEWRRSHLLDLPTVRTLLTRRHGAVRSNAGPAGRGMWS